MIFDSRFLESLYVPVPKQIIENFIGFLLFSIDFDKTNLKKVKIPENYLYQSWEPIIISNFSSFRPQIILVDCHSQLKCNMNEIVIFEKKKKTDDN
jgi:hypothetical protein